MTLIIGIKCKNGLIMAADSMTTEGAPSGGGKIARHESDKLVIYKNLLWGSSGSVGPKQAVQEAIQENYEKIYKLNYSPVTIRQKLVDLIHPITMKMYKQSFDQHTACGVQNRIPLPHINFVFGLYSQQDFHLINIEWDMAGEICDSKHFSTGSGMKTGQALLRRLRNHEWSIDVGVVVAYRTMNDAIHVEPEGIGPPIKIAKYQQREDGQMKIEMIGEAELNTVRDAAEIWMTMEQESLAKLDPAAIPNPVAEPPVPPSPVQ